MSQKVPVNNFKWVKDTSKINEEFIKNYNEIISKKGYILEVDVKYLKKLHDLHSDLPLLPKRMKIENVKNSFVICIIKKNMSYI